QIVTSLVQLVDDPKSLAPYSGEILAKLELTAMDPQPGVRSTAARAIAALATALGDECVEAVSEWAQGMMIRAGTTAERGGAAQTWMEICGMGTERRLMSLVDVIDKGVRDEA